MFHCFISIFKVEEQDFDGDGGDNLSDFVTVTIKDRRRNSAVSIDGASKHDSQKLSEKLGRKVQSGKRKMFNIGVNGKDVGPDITIDDSETSSRGEEDAEGLDGPVVSQLAAVRDGSHSATSSPQRQLRSENRQRAFSDTTLHKV